MIYRYHHSSLRLQYWWSSIYDTITMIYRYWNCNDIDRISIQYQYGINTKKLIKIELNFGGLFRYEDQGLTSFFIMHETNFMLPLITKWSLCFYVIISNLIASRIPNLIASIIPNLVNLNHIIPPKHNHIIQPKQSHRSSQT